MNQYREGTIHVRYGHGQVYPKGYRDKVLEKPWEAWMTNPDEIEKQLLSVPHVKNVFPRVSFYSFLNKGNLNLAGRGEGIKAERENQFFSKMNFEKGHDIQNPNQIILGLGLAKSLGAEIGDRITILTQTVNGQLNGADLELAGVFHTGVAEFDNSFYRIHLDAAQKLLDTKSVEHFALETDGVPYWNEVASGITQKLPNVDAIPFEELDAVYYKHSVAFLDSQFRVIRFIILFIVGLGIFNTIAVGLLERAPEVGALRANGESRFRLFGILCVENTLLGIAGGVLGIIFAILFDKVLLSRGIPMPAAPGITRQFIVFLQILPEHYVQALILPTVTAVVASLWPTFRLLRQTIPNLLKSH
jgi:putative ABC transport system permease protein